MGDEKDAEAVGDRRKRNRAVEDGDTRPIDELSESLPAAEVEERSLGELEDMLRTDERAGGGEAVSDTQLRDDPEERLSSLADVVGGDDRTSRSEKLGDLLNRVTRRDRSGNREASTRDDEGSDTTDGGAGAGGDGALLDEDVRNASNVLLLETSKSAGSDVCLSLLVADESTATNVLIVSLTRAATDRIEHLCDERDRTPAKLGLVTASDSVRLGGVSVPADSSLRDEDVTVKTLRNPADLTRLGIVISNVLSEWEESENRTLVCFDSLTTLLQYTNVQQTFRFLHALQNRLDQAGATTHYHMDGNAHDPQTVATFHTLFDAVLEVSEDGSVDRL